MRFAHTAYGSIPMFFSRRQLDAQRLLVFPLSSGSFSPSHIGSHDFESKLARCPHGQSTTSVTPPPSMIASIFATNPFSVIVLGGE